MEKNPSPRQRFWLSHQGEHHGKLVALFRMNHLVPPQTRAQEERMRQQQNPQPFRR